MPNVSLQPGPPTPGSRILPIALGAAATALAMGGATGAIAWLVAAAPTQLGVDPATRFVAFAFAVMGLTWLIALFCFACPGRERELADASGPRASARGSKRLTCDARSPNFNWPGLFRWAAAVDAAGIAVLVAATLSDAVTWREGLKLYLILASFATLQLAVAWLAWRVWNSFGRALLASIAFMALACTSLLWGHLPDRLTRPSSPADGAVLWIVRYINPLLAANDAVNPPTTFGWAHHGAMYFQYGIIGESRILGLPGWLHACGFYLLAAGVLGGAGMLPRRKRMQNAKCKMQNAK